jgi:acetyl-CoA synthetase
VASDFEGPRVATRSADLDYEQLRAEFRWEIPERFNIGIACADAQPASEPALVAVAEGANPRSYTFGDIAALSNRLANALRGLGVARGDRVGVVLQQGVETLLAHLAVYKLGAVAVPMSVLFGYDALLHRLRDSGARAVLTDGDRLDPVAEAAEEVDAGVVVAAARARDPHRSFWELVADGGANLEPVLTRPDDPALLIYTSGTTGPPKGALHGHRVLLGHQPGFRLSHDFFPQKGDRFWTPADWAWIGGLVNSLLCTLFHGRPMVGASRRAFDPEWSAQFVLEQRVRNVFLPPTALKMMRQAGVSLPTGTLRSVMSGGEVLGAELLDWARERLGTTINEIYGQTEANYVVGNSSTAWPVRPGSMGRPYPGHVVGVLASDGSDAASAEIGELAVRLPDPVAFLGYWNEPEATREKVADDWLRTGDLGRVDEDGYLWFHGRTDDVISSAGYRIGPEEVEQCLLKHPAVALPAVIGVPDPVRGQAIKAFISLGEGFSPSHDLELEIQHFVRERLAAYEYPRSIEFVEEIPLTVTGKVRRAELRRREEERARREAEGGETG